MRGWTHSSDRRTTPRSTSADVLAALNLVAAVGVPAVATALFGWALSHVLRDASAMEALRIGARQAGEVQRAVSDQRSPGHRLGS